MIIPILLFFLMLSNAINCVEPQIAVQFIRKFSSSCKEEDVRIYEGPYSSGFLVGSILGQSSLDNQLKTYEFCLNPVIHTIVATDTSSNGWYDGSSLTVSIDGTIILYDMLNSGGFVEWTIYPSYSLPKSSQWKYSTAVQSDSSWTQSTYDVTSWSSYSSGSFPAPQSAITRYYRTTITLPDLSNFATFELGINAKEGMIVYINGQELNRKNLPNGIITGYTLATTLDSTYEYRRITHSIKKYIGTKTQIVIAVEIHPTSTSSSPSTTDLFDGFFLPLFGTCSKRTHDGTISTIPSTGDISYKDEAFDNNIKTSVIWNNPIYPISFIYKFNDGRREWINKYEIVSTSYVPKGDPQNFSFLGSNDNGNTWDLLDINAAVTFSARKESKMFSIPSNGKAYNMYKLEITSVVDQLNFCRIGEIEFYSCNTDIITDFVYEQSSYTWYKDLDSVYLSPHSSGLKTFTLTSPTTLPQGLTFVPTTGEIYGTPVTTYEGTFVITAIDAITGRTLSCTLSITIIECDGINYKHLQIIKKAGSHAWSEFVNIYDSNNKQVFSTNGLDMSEITSNICLPTSIYTLEMKDIDSDAWDKSSILIIILVNKYSSTTIFRDTLVDKGISTSKLNIDYIINDHDPNVLCYTKATTVPTNWYTTSYTPDTNWTPCLALETRPTSSVRTQFFRHTFTVTSKTDMHLVELSLKSSEATVIYINDNEVYRHGLPDGDITISTIPTTTSTAVYSRRSSIDISKINIGTNTISIAQVYPEDTLLPVEVIFDFSLRLDGTSSTHSRNWDLSVSGPSKDNEGVDLLIDNKITTRWMYEAPYKVYTPFNLTFTYTSSSQYSYINKYCFISNYNTIEADPVEWNVYGCNNNICDSLGSESNIMWTARNQRQCFYMNPHTKSYHSYIFSISKNADYGTSKLISLSEIQLLTADLSNIVTSPLIYTPNTIIGYKDTDISTVTPVPNYHSFSIIETTLPKGVYIDSNTGYIYGSPTTLSPLTTYTIQAYNLQGIASTTTISIMVTFCTYPNSIFKIKIDNPGDNDGEEMGFQILDHDTKEFIDSRSYFPDYSTSFYSYCQPEGVYDLILTDTYKDSWRNGKIYVLLSDNIPILTATLLAGETPKTLQFENKIITASSSIIWTYLNSNTIPAPIGSSWTTVPYTNSDWSIGTIDSFTVPKGITQYYRTIFTVSDITRYVAFQLNLNLKAGAVVYLNGIELRRYNMPAGIITSTSLATSDYTNVETVIDIFSIQYDGINLVLGQNVLAIETHKGYFDITQSFFEASIVFYENDVKMLINGNFDSSKGTGAYSGNIKYAFDDDTSTKWATNAACSNAWGTWTYNDNRRVFINSYTITNGDNCNRRHPSDWTFEGSNDNGATWTALHHASTVRFTSFLQKKTFEFAPEQSYNKYRLKFEACNNPAISGDSSACLNDYNLQISEITLNINRRSNLCSAFDGYPATVHNHYAYKSCNDGTDNKKKRYCSNGIFGEEDNSLCSVIPTLTYPESVYTFNATSPIIPIIPTISNITGYMCIVNPSLPIGLVLDVPTCTISGTPSFQQQSTSYIITAISGPISVSTYLSIIINKIEILVENSISYNPTEVSVTINTPLNIIPIVTGDSVSTWFVSPRLPTGIHLDLITGIISGTTSVITSSIRYTVSAIPLGTTNPITTMITITTKAYDCPIDDIWPSTIAGVTATSPCIDSQKEGQITRVCDDTGAWEDPVDSCTYIIPTITITPSSVTLYTSESATITPITQQYVSSWTVTPSLPNGLAIDSSTGIITGTPTTIQVATTYTITASNPTGNGQATVSITINSRTCPLDGVWSTTNAGATATSPCTDSQKEGQVTRICGSTGVWEAPVDGCTYIIPTVTITPSAVTLYTTESATITPTTQQFVTSWTVTPSLPNGLTIDELTGIIMGTPTTIQVAATYIVKATNIVGFGQASISITINSRTCPLDGVWSTTNAGATATSPCTDSLKEGQLTRICGPTGIWQSAIDSCTYKAPVITLDPLSYTFYKDENAEIIPTAENQVNSWIISPSLPIGMNLNSNTGMISGSPLYIQPAIQYTLSALNSDKSALISASITVISRTCDVDGEWPVTDVGTTAYILCENSSVSTRSRACTHIGNAGQWEAVNTTTCYSISNEDIPVQDRTFIRLPIYFYGITSTFFDATQIYILQKNLDDYIDSLNVPNTKIFIESIQSYSSFFFSDSIIVTTRVECNEVESISIKDSLTSYMNTSLLPSLQSSSSSNYNAVTSVNVSPNEVTLLNYNFWTGSAIAVTIIIVIVIVIIIGIAVLFFVYKQTYGSNSKITVDNIKHMFNKKNQKIKPNKQGDKKQTTDIKTTVAKI
ncbi:hypothetical protein WA158_006456 [Blastocystis sp. Blastoise]